MTQPIQTRHILLCFALSCFSFSWRVCTLAPASTNTIEDGVLRSLRGNPSSVRLYILLGRIAHTTPQGSYARNVMSQLREEYLEPGYYHQAGNKQFVEQLTQQLASFIHNHPPQPVYPAHTVNAIFQEVEAIITRAINDH